LIVRAFSTLCVHQVDGALGTGDGAELRQPLGIAIVGGLVLSQLLTLYTTPVVFVLMDRLVKWTTPGAASPLPPQGGDTGGPAKPDPRCPLGYAGGSAPG